MSISFSGGIRIRADRRTVDCEARTIMPCPYHIYPLKGRWGVYKPLVKPGDSVLAAQKIAVSEDGIAYLYSSVSGRVTEICARAVAGGETADAVVIENDELYTRAELRKLTVDYKELIPEQIADILIEAGLGETDDAQTLKLVYDGCRLKQLIVDCVQSEPYSTSAYRVTAEHGDEVIDGVNIAKYMFGVKRASIAVEGNVSECMNSLKRAARYDESIDIISVKRRYPQSAPQMLVKTLAGRTIGASQRPEEVGCVIIKAETAAAISRIIREGLPITEKIITVDGNAVTAPDNFIVPLGVPLSFLLAEAGTLLDKEDELIIGGMITGKKQETDEIPVTADMSAVIVMKSAAERKRKLCTHCGRCIRRCPMKLNPRKLYKASLAYKLAKARKNHAENCISCGVCTYVCPAEKELAEYIADIRDAIIRIG